MSSTRIKIGAIIVGWITSWFIIISAIATIAVAILLPGFDATLNSNFIPNEPPAYALASLMLAVFLAFFAGGYVSGRMAALSGMVNGVMVVAITFLFFAFAITFLSIVGQKLGINLIGIAGKSLSPYGGYFSGAILLAIAGSLAGGKLGEGYFERIKEIIK
ncbi:MAG: hypothetical protein HY779_04410 [Rubrobacteridae bacterium]|nr:hypothetical protein [Rubrobacteridae bacterium]